MLWVVCTCLATTLFVACDPSANYNYIISNESSGILNLSLFPEGVVEDDPLYDGYYSYNDICYIGNETSSIPKFPSSIIIKPGAAVKFWESIELTGVVDIPENDGARPIWLEHNCLRKLIVENSEGEIVREIPVEYWSNRDNWIRQNKTKYYVEYWLKIDDSVISQESALQPIN